jgi:hypothetical protein
MAPGTFVRIGQKRYGSKLSTHTAVEAHKLFININFIANNLH